MSLILTYYIVWLLCVNCCVCVYTCIYYYMRCVSVGHYVGCFCFSVCRCMDRWRLGDCYVRL